MALFKRSQQQVVDLREATAVVTPPAPAPAPRRFGRPSRCPDCNGKAFLDHIDIVDRVQYEHCVECGKKWQLTEAELAKPDNANVS
jgi:Zn ribbon nucleic-acid-binding protein